MRARAASFYLLLLILGTGSGPVFGQTGSALTVTANVEGASSISRFEPLVLTLSRALEAEEGRLSVFLDHTDLTALFTPFGTTLRYTPDLLPLPSGEAHLIVYRVAPDDQWQELARWPVRVRLPGGFDMVVFDPSLSLSNKGQVDEGRFPKPTEELPHRIYQDFSGQFNGKVDVKRSGFAMQAQFNVVGVSYQNEALRFNEKAEEAPKVDLSRYLVEVQRGGASLRLGHVSHGQHRHLINNFGSRGTMGEVKFGNRVDASVAALNGSRIVGWSNPLGLQDPSHRMVSSALGVELLKNQPGGLRLEASYLDGSVLPRAGFNQGAVVDAEKSRGLGGRLLAGTRNRRLRLEAGFSGSRFTNPDDPSLAQGDDLVAVEATTRYAHYLDLSVGVLQNVMVSPSLPVSLSARLHRERVDPLYRTVAAFVRPDVLQQGVEVQAGFGPIQAQVGHNRAEDNLDRIASILKTKTRQNNVNLTVPMASLVGASAAKGRSLLPGLGYSLAQTHQFGADLPVEGGFNASHIPDQLSTTHSANADWNGNGWRLGYRFSHAFQDNRQEGREDADFLNVTNSVSLGVNPWRFLDLNLDLSFDRAENKDTERIERTRRLGVRGTLRPTQSLTINASLSPTRMQDADLISRRTSNSINLEAAWSFNLGSGQQKLARGQVFVRYARRESRNRDITFDLDQENHNWAVNTGVSLTLF